MSDLISSLINLAQQRGLADYVRREPEHDPAFAWRPVHYLIDLDCDGKAVGVSPTISQRRTSMGKPEDILGKAFLVPVRYALGSSNKTPQEFLVAKCKAFFPATGDQPMDWKGAGAADHCWSLVIRAARSNFQPLAENRDIKALAKFIETQPTKEWLGEFCKQLKVGKPKDAETISFRVDGRLIFRTAGVQQWWSRLHRIERLKIHRQLPKGIDLFQPGEGRLCAAAPTVFGNTPLVSFSRPQTTSFGLGDGTSHLRIDTAERAAAALNDLHEREASRFKFGDNRFLYWAADESQAAPLECSFVSLLDRPDPLQVHQFLAGVFGPKQRAIAGAFHAVVLRCPKGRFQVRAWHTKALTLVQEGVEEYFETARGLSGSETIPSMMQLAECLRSALRAKASPDDRKILRSELANAFAALANTALWGWPLPPEFLQAALLRQQAEVASGDKNDKDFFPQDRYFPRLRARSTVIHLSLEYANHRVTKSSNMNNPSTNDGRNHPAYRLGRLLGMLSKIHNHAHGGKSASDPGSRYYASASKTPSLVFPRLLQLAGYHLEKMSRADKEVLQLGRPDLGLEGLSQLAGWFHNHGAEFGRMLSLEKQGRFAIGFYRELMLSRKWDSALTKPTTPAALSDEPSETEDQDSEINTENDKD
jgi:CRISPR-associated protein Csd1